MPKYAVIRNGLVENVILANTQPTIPGRTAGDVTLLPVSPGDTYNGSVFTPRVPSATEVRAAAAVTRLTNARVRLRQIRDQAAANATGGAFASLAAASTAIRLLAGAVADLSQNILDLELVAAYQQDDGAE